MQGRRCKECGIETHRRPNAALNLKVKKKYRAAIRETFKATGQRKNTKSRELLGYGVKELRERITTHPNWERVRHGKWHLDHVFPITAFIEFGIMDPRLINCLENLQPLTDMENMSKGNKYDKEQFIQWLKEKNVFNLAAH